MWIQLALFVVMSLLSYALRPKQQGPKASTIDEVKIPTIEQGTEVGVAFGDVWIDTWMVCWYGDLRNTPIKKKPNKK